HTRLPGRLLRPRCAGGGRGGALGRAARAEGSGGRGRARPGGRAGAGGCLSIEPDRHPLSDGAAVELAELRPRDRVDEEELLRQHLLREAALGEEAAQLLETGLRAVAGL